MLLILSDDGSSLTLDGSDDFTRLNVLASRDISGASVFAECRRTPDGHLFVPPQLIEDLAGANGMNDHWRKNFDAMVEFARSTGWVDDAGAMRVHVEYTADVSRATED